MKIEKRTTITTIDGKEYYLDEWYKKELYKKYQEVKGEKIGSTNDYNKRIKELKER